MLFLSLIPVQTQAGVIPCGLSQDDPDQPGDQTVQCQLCHLFVLLDNIVDFVLFKIVLPVATLLLVIGGILFIFNAENPENVTKGKAILTSVLIGLVIIFAAYLIIGTFLNFIGLSGWTADVYKDWLSKGFFEIDCPL